MKRGSLLDQLTNFSENKTIKALLIILFTMVSALVISVTTQQPSNPPVTQNAPSSEFDDQLLGVSRLEVTVEHVVDGDTIKVAVGDQKATVRLIGVDTPETVDPRKPVQCFGKEASQRLRNLVEGKNVYLQIDTTQDNVDRYDRLLRYVFLNDVLINQQLIAEGYGFQYTYDEEYEYKSEFVTAEAYARENNLGLWSPDTCNGNTMQ